MLNSVELEVGAVKVSGDPNGPDLRTVLRAYYSSRWSRIDEGPEMELKVDAAIERIVNQAVESIRTAQAPRSVVMTGLVPYVRA